MCNVVEMKSVAKSFRNTEILSNINLTVKEGDILGIIGRNGCGKSVLFKLICGLMLPTKGKVKVWGKIISNGNFPENIGIMLDNTGFIPYDSGFDNLKHIAVINNVVTEEEIKDCIRLVGLDPEDKKPVKKYSLGMKQRLGIAMAIMERPKLLLLDEPMNSLDNAMVHEVRKLLLYLNQNENMTIITTSHNDEDIKTLCNRVMKLEDGCLHENLYTAQK